MTSSEIKMKVKQYELELVALMKTSNEPPLQELMEHAKHGGRVETCDNCQKRFMVSETQLLKSVCNICYQDFCLACGAVHAPYCALLRSL